VGHTDALFFQLFEDGEPQDPVSPMNLADEVQQQLSVIRAEFESTIGVRVTTGEESTQAH